MKRVSEWYDLDSLHSFYNRVDNTLKASDKIHILGSYFDSKYIEDEGILDLKVETEYWKLLRKNQKSKIKQDRINRVDRYFDMLDMMCAINDEYHKNIM